MDTMLSQQDKYKVDEAMRLIDHRFNNINWPWEALQASGSGVKLIGDRRVIDGNKILAPLGDSLIRLFAVEAMIDSNIATKSKFGVDVKVAYSLVPRNVLIRLC